MQLIATIIADNGPWFSEEDHKKLSELPAGTKLYIGSNLAPNPIYQVKTKTPTIDGSLRWMDVNELSYDYHNGVDNTVTRIVYTAPPEAQTINMAAFIEASKLCDQYAKNLKKDSPIHSAVYTIGLQILNLIHHNGPSALKGMVLGVAFAIRDACTKKGSPLDDTEIEKIVSKTTGDY
jgi:hypothetical protein